MIFQAESDAEMLAYLHGALWSISKFVGEYPQSEFAELIEDLLNSVDQHIQKRDLDSQGQEK